MAISFGAQYAVSSHEMVTIPQFGSALSVLICRFLPHLLPMSEAQAVRDNLIYKVVQLQLHYQKHEYSIKRFNSLLGEQKNLS